MIKKQFSDYYVRLVWALYNDRDLCDYRYMILIEREKIKNVNAIYHFYNVKWGDIFNLFLIDSSKVAFIYNHEILK